MPEQLKKRPCAIGLLAHVGASRREPQFYCFLPGPKTGDFSHPSEVKLFQALKYHHMLRLHRFRNRSIWWLIFGIRLCSCFQNQKRVGIGENISVSRKDKFVLLIGYPFSKGIPNTPITSTINRC